MTQGLRGGTVSSPTICMGSDSNLTLTLFVVVDNTRRQVGRRVGLVLSQGGTGPDEVVEVGHSHRRPAALQAVNGITLLRPNFADGLAIGSEWGVNPGKAIDPIWGIQAALLVDF